MSYLLAQASPQGGGLMAMLIPFALMFALLYFLIIRPQKKKEQVRQAMLANVKKNDHVLTTGGIFGVVTAVKDNEVTLKIDERNDVKVRMSKSAIVGVERPGEKTAEPEGLKP